MNMTPFYTPSRSTNRVGSFIPHATPPGLDNGNEMTPEDSYLSRPRHLVPQGHHNTPPRSNEHQEVQRLRQEVDTLRGEVDSLRQQVGVKEKQPSKKIPPELSVSDLLKLYNFGTFTHVTLLLIHRLKSSTYTATLRTNFNLLKGEFNTISCTLYAQYLYCLVLFAKIVVATFSFI